LQTISVLMNCKILWLLIDGLGDVSLSRDRWPNVDEPGSCVQLQRCSHFST
jgi:hypothetical protein